LNVLYGAAAGFKKSSWSGITYYTRNMPHNGSNSSGSRRTSMQQQQQPLERHSSPPAHARQQWYEQAAAAARQEQEAEQEELLSGASCSNGAGSDVPFVLLHGIGMGLIPYISLLFNMAATGEGLHSNLCGSHALGWYECWYECCERWM
jgi:hypothetical protein